MPLTEFYAFKTKLERRNRIRIPKVLRWRYKMEPGETLKVSVRVFNSENYEKEAFFARMTSDGRLTLPRLAVQIMQQREEKILTGVILEVALSPVHT
jgi:bifunctional DNA-binding transcriptional regulator/antitoxin component of YhaV-PrlF toxin-antitoxin module